MASILERDTIRQLADEYNSIDLAGLLTELKDWKAQLSRHWSEQVTEENIDTFVDLLLEYVY